MWMLIILIIIGLTILLWQISNIISVFFGCPYVKTNRDTIRKALKLVEIKKGDIFYDLGCGNGDVVIEASKLGAQCIGYEISPYYYILSKIRIWIYLFFAGAKNKYISIEFKNIQDVDLRKADVVYCYLLPKFLEKLSSKLKKELKPSARIISIGFPIKNSTFSARVKKVEKYQIKNHLVFIYTKKSAA